MASSGDSTSRKVAETMFDRCIENVVINTGAGLVGGLAAGVTLFRKRPFMRAMGIGAGIGVGLGMALYACDVDFKTPHLSHMTILSNGNNKGADDQ